MSKYKIEKDVPIPRKGKGNLNEYPFLEMLVGDSVLIPKVKRVNLNGSIDWAVRKNGGKYATRTVDGGVRVWRIL